MQIRCKILLFVLMLMSVFCACAVDLDQSTVMETQYVDITTQEPMKTQETPFPNIEETPLFPDQQQSIAESETTTIPKAQVFETTICVREPENEYWKHTFYNEQLDYLGLQIEILECVFSDAVPAIKLRVTLPQNWPEDVSNWMRREGLRLQFEIDGQQVDAFRQREVSYLNGDQYEISYETCILSNEVLAAASSFTVRPYIECYETVWSRNTVETVNGKEPEQFDLSDGEAFSGIYMGENNSDNRNYINELSFRRNFLDDYAQTIFIEENPRTTLQPVHEIFSFKETDWEENRARGVYEDGAQDIPEKATYSLQERDVSEMQFVLDQFHIWPEEIKLAFTLRLPESWTDIECQSLSQDWDIAFIVDGEMQTTGRVTDHNHLFFGREGKLNGDSPDQIRQNLNENNYQTETYRERHFVNWKSNLSVEEWKTKSNLTIIPYCRRYLGYADIPFDADGTLVDGRIDTPEYERFFLYDLAISIDITPDLFADGF